MFGAKRSKVLRWKKFAPGPVRVIFSSRNFNQHKGSRLLPTKLVYVLGQWLLQSGPMFLPLPPPVEVEVQVEYVAPPPVPARALGCTKCRFQVTGLQAMSEPFICFHVGKGEGKAQPKAQAAKAKANAGNGRGRAKGRGRGK